jgi:hypothetical protein
VVTKLRRPARPLPDPGNQYDRWWSPGSWMVRLYHEVPSREPLNPRTYGPLNRFDPHVRDRQQRPREQIDGRGVLYLAENLGCALAEGLPEQSPEIAICPGRYLIMVSPVRSLRLLDLTGDGAMKIGAVATLVQETNPVV